MGVCIFCNILTGKLPASQLYRDSLCTAFMDIQPINPGHLLVVPNRHAARLVDLEEEAGAQMFRVAQLLAGAVSRSGVKCEGVNLFLADGEAAGQEVLHAHLHVIPRFAGDGFGLKFGPHYHKKPARAELDQLAQQIRAAL